jgi:hypothetical protein
MIILCLLAVFAFPALAAAVEVTKVVTTDTAKKLSIEVHFDAEVQPVDKYYYDGNYVDLYIENLKVPSKWRKDYSASDPSSDNFFKVARFETVDNEYHFRFYLEKPADPSDVVVAMQGDFVKFELSKPFYKLPLPGEDNGESGAEEDSGAEGVEEDGDTQFIPDAGDTGTPDAIEIEYTPVEGETGEADGDTADGTATEIYTPVEPAAPDTAEPTVDDDRYTLELIDATPVARVQVSNTAFNEAVMMLVAGTGFNVIIGPEVDAETATLDFTQKEMSLKSALDILALVYGLKYVVEDDAIIIQSQ